MHAVWRVERQYNGASDYTVEDSTPSTEHGYLEGMGYTNVTTVSSSVAGNAKGDNRSRYYLSCQREPGNNAKPIYAK
ncbi:hypothetical protein AFLA_008291 [Aspergillus flavus NRRL3357]|nr:hypothetical protein AFLA_008291 [Aspergillus flavus NRRL3357]